MSETFYFIMSDSKDGCLVLATHDTYADK